MSYKCDKILFICVLLLIGVSPSKGCTAGHRNYCKVIIACLFYEEKDLALNPRQLNSIQHLKSYFISPALVNLLLANALQLILGSLTRAPNR